MWLKLELGKVCVDILRYRLLLTDSEFSEYLLHVLSKGPTY